MATRFINEIHYDNAGACTGEAIEIAGPAVPDLSGWSLALHNGNGGAVNGTIPFTGTIPCQDNGFGANTLSGGNAANRFVFGPGGGNDTVLDFGGGDRLVLTDGSSVAGVEERDANGDGTADTVVLLGDGGAVASLGVAGVADFGNLLT